MKTLALMVSNSTHKPQTNKPHLNKIPPPSNLHLLYIQMDMLRKESQLMSVFNDLHVYGRNKQEPKHHYECSCGDSHIFGGGNQWCTEQHKVNRWKETER